MPREGSSNRAFRMPDLAGWERFGELAEPDRSEVLRQFIAWFNGEPGAELPKRPAPASRTTTADQGEPGQDSAA